MPWISINPNSEPRTSVEVVADEFNLMPHEVTPCLMAEYYNVVDPTVAKLEVTPEATAKFVDRWISSQTSKPDE